MSGSLAMPTVDYAEDSNAEPMMRVSRKRIREHSC